MKLEINLRSLEDLVIRMGAEPIRWDSSRSELDELSDFQIELQRGIEIDIHDVEKTGPGLLTYRGEQVLLYIKDTHLDKETLLYDPEHSRRFHVADCETIKKMRDVGRIERYVVTIRTDGLFLVDAEDHITGKREENLEAPLMVCRNCLKFLDYKSYDNGLRRNKKAIWREFSIPGFFEEHESLFKKKPKYTDKTVPKGGYTKDWPEVSLRVREERNWTCEKCKVHLHAHKNLLHAHHKNGSTWDNRRSNLVALCTLCHGKEPMHRRMGVKKNDAAKIHELRARQGLT